MYKKKPNHLIKHFDFLCLDGICFVLVMFLSYYIRHNSFQFRGSLYDNVTVYIVMIHIVAALFQETYKNILRRGLWAEFVSVVKHSTIILVCINFFLFFIKQGNESSRTVLLLQWGISIPVLLLCRELRKYYLKKEGKNVRKRNMVLICGKKRAPEIMQKLCKYSYEHIEIDGIILCEKNISKKEINGIPVVAAGLEDGIEYLKRGWVDEVFIQLPANEENKTQMILEKCETMGIITHVSLDRFLDRKRQIIEKVGDYAVITTTVKLVTLEEMWLKRFMDICGSLIGLFITGILCVFVAPIIYIKSPGPIFFSQERVGKNGKKFKMYKFRSMYIDAEERKAALMAQNELASTLMFKIEDDPRIIGGKNGIGGFIRRTSIDEFPQFWNVLKGDMSLVGTRPPTVDEWEAYEEHHRKRLAIKPGITGLWQISGRSNIKNFEEVVKLDTEYINDWSLAMDVKILVKTVLMLLKRDGAM